METNSELYERYSRQLLLKGFGETGQHKLLAAKVLVAGAGGLGCPVLQYLAAAGVGTIGIADDDIVSLSDLHRQILYSVNDIGASKAERAAGVIKQLNPGIQSIVYNERLTVENTLSIIEQFDIVVDATDNFPARYMINDACVLLKKPLVSGAVSQFEGQVAIFNCPGKDGELAVNYRDLFPVPPREGEINNCAQAGVLGVLPGIIGAMQANETIKLITGIGQPLVNRLLVYNALNNQSYELALTHREDTNAPGPQDTTTFKATDYGLECRTPSAVQEITVHELEELIQKEKVTAIDVREWGEEPVLGWFPHNRIPLSQLNTSTANFDGDTLVFICQTGKRSIEAIRRLNVNDKKMYSLKGGILQWQKFQQMKEQV
jgi:molybdopterin/thiamine biosynthesis adenylyltransferase/rhodanese-related sulfurtransferase